MRMSHLIAALLLACGVAGCSDKAVPAAATPAVGAAPAAVASPASKETLMTAVFGKLYRPASKDALAEMPMFGERKKIRLFDVVPLVS